jgi:methylglyoxal synthase
MVQVEWSVCGCDYRCSYPDSYGAEMCYDAAMRSTIALIAHDGKKDDMVRFVQAHKEVLGGYRLIATGTTGERVARATGLEVTRMLSGPYGGDAEIAAQVAEGQVCAVIFLVDPLYAHPHEPDIQGLLRICNVYNIPVATNEATASLVVGGLPSRGA